jgi:hypothetical protein
MSNVTEKKIMVLFAVVWTAGAVKLITQGIFFFCFLNNISTGLHYKTQKLI